MAKQKGTVLIIGAGPAGLSAAYDLLKRTDLKPVIFEAESFVGGISRTANYKGNRIDIGGHRFFSKDKSVLRFWDEIMPMQGKPSLDDILMKKENPALSQKKGAPDPQKTDRVMLIRNRLSRIYFLKKFFNYPVTLSFLTLKNLGVWRTIKVGFSYLKASFFPIKPEKNLEDFYINRFGKELYNTFFGFYTEKLWGVPCRNLRADWGAQRANKISISSVLKNAVMSALHLNGKNKVKSFIDEFHYPKYGPGQLWEEVAKQVVKMGGEIRYNSLITGVDPKKNTVTVLNKKTKKKQTVRGNYIFSTMPVKDLVAAMPGVPKDVAKIASELPYRDFMTVGLLLDEVKIKNKTPIKTYKNRIPDTWIYVQERTMKTGRLQIFNNWSPYMVKDFENTMWIGLEYFVFEGDEYWTMKDKDMIALATRELKEMGFIAQNARPKDATVIRVKKAYPSYYGAYNQFGKVREYLDSFQSLVPLGRNGMHRYNNMDHSVLTGFAAVDYVIKGRKDKSAIWNVNTEQEYHEEKTAAKGKK